MLRAFAGDSTMTSLPTFCRFAFDFARDFALAIGFALRFAFFCFGRSIFFG